MVHFYRIIIYVGNNSLIKLLLKHFFGWSIYLLIFIFPPGGHTFLKYLVIINFIVLCKLFVINIKKNVWTPTKHTAFLLLQQRYASIGERLDKKQ